MSASQLVANQSATNGKAFGRTQWAALTETKPQRLELEGIGTAYLRIMSIGGRDSIDAHRDKDTGIVPNWRARHLQLVLCDEDGKLLFTEADLELLAQLPVEVADKVILASLTVNGLGEAALEAAVGE